MRYDCPWCDKQKSLGGFCRPEKVRYHVNLYHPEADKGELERSFVQKRYPDLDIDLITQRYVDSLETMIGLQYQGLFIKKYLQTIGVARSAQADKRIMGYHIRMAMPPEVRFAGYLKRDIAALEKRGFEELVPAVTALKIIKFAKKRLLEIQTEKVEEVS